MDSVILLGCMGVSLVCGLLIGWDDGFRTGYRRAREHLYYLPRVR
jgi:hypothetical protein